MPESQPPPAPNPHAARLRRVLEHIDAHLEEPLGVESLSHVAAFSKFHFHRQFSLFVGMGVHRYVQLVRLKRACYELAFRNGRRILEIALSSGYDSHEAFARAFKKALAQTPSEFRAEPSWSQLEALLQPLTEIRSQFMNESYEADSVRIVDFPATRIAVLEHHGDPRRIGDSIRRFIEWRRSHGLHPRHNATFNLLYTDPADTPPEEFRLDLGAALGRSTPELADGMRELTIPAGRCAVLRHVGSDSTLRAAFSYLYTRWLPQSGEELRDFPLYLQRVAFFPDVPEHEAIVDIFLPLA